MSRREAHTALDPSTDRRPGIRDGPPQLARDDRYVAIWASRTNGAFWPVRLIRVRLLNATWMSATFIRGSASMANLRLALPQEADASSCGSFAELCHEFSCSPGLDGCNGRPSQVDKPPEIKQLQLPRDRPRLLSPLQGECRRFDPVSAHRLKSISKPLPQKARSLLTGVLRKFSPADVMRRDATQSG
ncbi:MAG: hypothetical protein JWO52_2614 [Gammaproteobacteria bacterium]|nr:hypothetical protein [Gammaproteobacteria bacterium]